MPPERDEEIHRHQHHFPEEEEHEQVDGQEHADDTAQNPHQVKVEETHLALDFLPRAQHRQDAEQTGQQNHQQRQAIECQVHVDTEAGDPWVVEFQGPGRIGTRRRRVAEVAGRPQPEAEDQFEGHCQQRNPARQGRAEALTQPAQQAADKRDQD